MDFSDYPTPLRKLLLTLTSQLSSLWYDYETGDITLSDWYDQMIAELTRYQTAAYMAGTGSAALTPAAVEKIAGYVKAQIVFLDNFRLVLQDTAEFMPGWQRRAESYATSIVAPYWAGKTAPIPPGLPMPGDGTTLCGQNCKCQWEIEPAGGEDNYDLYWTLRPAEHCQTCLERAETWKPLRVRGGRLEIPANLLSKEYPVGALEMVERFKEAWQEVYKHLPGRHNQKRHGWRFGSSAKRPEGDEGDAYDKRAQGRASGKREPAPKAPKEVRGSSTVSFGNDPNTTYEMQFKVVDLDNLITSNTTAGGVNPEYSAELQPRVRSRFASQQQIDQVARSLVPESLILDFHQLDKGPMIVGADNMVESGNGRTLALMRAKELYPEKWAAYQEALRKNLNQAGIKESDIAGMKNPVLVRERQSNVDRAAFAKEANSPPVLQMSPMEQALQDASRLSSDILNRFQMNDGQTIDQALRSPANREFVRRFVGDLSANERGAILRADGSLNQMGLWRVKAAIFAKVFPGEAGQRIADTFLESLDSGIKNVETALSAALPKLAKAENLISSGQRSSGLSMTGHFSKAIDMLARLRESGISVSDYLNQLGLFGSELNRVQMRILQHLDTISRRPTAMRAFFEKYADMVISAPQAGQASMFGGMDLKFDDLLERLMGETANA